MIIPNYENIYLFVITAILMITIPGPAIIYIISKSIEQGYKAGIVSTLGIETGGLIHVFCAALGLSAIVMISSTAFHVLKYFGAIYLIYLGIKKLTSGVVTGSNKKGVKKATMKQLYFEGILVNLLNPKTALFFLMFLPQFVNEDIGNVTSQIVFLGVLLILICMIIDLIYVVISGKLGTMIKENTFFHQMNRYIVGVVYLFLGLLALFVSRPVSVPSSK